MNLLRDVIAELVGMFVGDARLSAAVLAVVAASAAARVIGADLLVVGGILLGGSLLVMVEGVRRSARRVPVEAEPTAEPSGPE